MKKSHTIFFTLFPILIATGTETSASPVPNNMCSQEPVKIIRLVERAQDFTLQDNGAPGPSLGDHLIFTSDLFDLAGQKVGRDGADCVTVRADSGAPPEKQQVVQCTITVELSDGQITFQGLARGTENIFAITGGTGAYATVHGEALAHDRVPLQEADITITLFR